MTEALVTRYHAALADEVLALLRTEDGWLSSHQLLQRCELAQDGDHLGETLARLYREGKVQTHADKLGLRYALIGVTPCAVPVREARGPHSAAEAQANERTPPPERKPPADIAALRHANVQAINAAIREQMVAMFQQQPLRAASDFRAALGRSQVMISSYLRAMREDGLVKAVGAGRAAKFRWVGPGAEPTASAPVPVVDAAPIVMPTAPAGVKAELWSSVRPRVIELFRDTPILRSAEAAERLGKSKNSASIYLANLEDEGLVARRGAGMATAFEWMGPAFEPKPATPSAAPITPEKIEALAGAIMQANRLGPHNDAAEARFAVWSDGRFEIDLGDERLVLAPQNTRRLFHFVQFVDMPE